MMIVPCQQRTLTQQKIQMTLGVGEETETASSSRFYSGWVADGVDPATRFERVAAHSMSFGQPNRWDWMMKERKRLYFVSIAIGYTKGERGRSPV